MESDYQLAISLQNELNNNHPQNIPSTTDHDLAKFLQDEYDSFVDIELKTDGLVASPKRNNRNRQMDSSKCLGDPSWEVIDPTPDVHALFVAFNQRFFWNELGSVTVEWSKRMTSCAGICSYMGTSGACKITLSECLLKLRPRKDLVETLLHEMIHAYLFIDGNREHESHGPEFHQHMNRINAEAGLNITVYHNFHDEVLLYQKHWWRCNGSCQRWPPYFGIIRRSMNRAPGPKDRWWFKHLNECGGQFIKIRTPEAQHNNTKKPLPTPAVTVKTGSATSKSTTKPATITGPITSGDPNSQSTSIKTWLNNSTAAKNTKIPIEKPPVFNGPEKLLIPMSSSSPVPSTSSANITSARDTVREHWSKKYDNIETGKKRPIDTKPGRPLKKIHIKLTVPIVSCPICQKQVDMESLNTHLDDCLESSNKQFTTCLICGIRFKEQEFEAHKTWCFNTTFTDETVSNPEKLLRCICCLGLFDSNSYDEHRKTCSQNEPIDLTESDNDLNDIQCPTCKQVIDLDDIDQHIDRCSGKKEEQDNATMTPCLLCDKKMPKVDLNSHLEVCAGISFIDSFGDSQEDEKGKDMNTSQYNCPFCFELFTGNEMQEHLDKCYKKDEFLCDE